MNELIKKSSYKYKRNPLLNRGDKIFKNKRDHYWYSGKNPQKPLESLYTKAEEMGVMVLQREGFSNIDHVAISIGKKFPFDYLAEKGGKRYAVEITCGQRKEKTQKLEKMLSVFNLEMLFIFIKPDLSTYFISNPEDKRRCWYFSDCEAKPLLHTGNVNPYITFFNHIVSPFNFNNLQQVSYDLTLFRVYEIMSGGSIKNGKTKLPPYLLKKPRNGVFSLKAGKAYSFDFCENITLPSTMYGMIYPRSSANRMGVLITSGIFDPGFSNRIGAVARISQDVEIKKFDRVATLLLWWANAAKSYEGQWQQH